MSSNEYVDNIIESLESLKLLEIGWLDGIGTSYSYNDIEFVKNKILKYFSKINNLILPGVFPVYNGDIVMEWYFDDISLDLNINFLKKQILITLYSKESVNEKLFKLTNDNDWNKIILLLENIFLENIKKD